MSRFIRRATMAALLASTASMAVVTTMHPVDAAQRAAPAKAPANAPRREIGIPLNDAIKALQAMDYTTALAKMQVADKVEKKTPYEEYLVAKYLGIVALGQPMRDYAAATAAYDRMVASGACPDADKEAMYDVAMKLDFQAMEYPKVLAAAAELKKIRPLDPVGFQMVTQIYYQGMDYPNTIASAKEALAATKATGEKPNVGILGMLLNAQAKSMDPGYRETLDTLATVTTQAEVWTQVMDYALAAKGISDHQLLNTFRLALRVGTMREADYAAMASIDLASGLSVEGKNVLDKAIAAGTIKSAGNVATLLQQANGLSVNEQKSLPELAAEAAKQPNGEIYVKLGESYWAYGQIDQAVDAMQKGIDKGGLKDTADAQTTLGIMLLDAGKKPEAMAAFQKAEAAGGSGGTVAHVWNLFTQRAA